MTTKEILLDLAERLPPDATLQDAIYELELRQAVEDGLASLDHGVRIPLEDVRKCVLDQEPGKAGSFLEGLRRLGRVPAGPRDKRPVRAA